jgi:hypothetical protein
MLSLIQETLGRVLRVVLPEVYPDLVLRFLPIATGLPDTKVGTFTKALYEEAKRKGRTIVNMKQYLKQIFAVEK